MSACRLNIETMAGNVDYLLPLSSLIAGDLPKGYFFPYCASTYNENFWLRNVNKYVRFDISKNRTVEYMGTVGPQRVLSVFGDEIPILMDQEPPTPLSEHWRRWMSGFASPVLKKVKEGLTDNSPVMTYMATESIRSEKHFIDPDLLYKLQLKSTIPEIGVQCPKHYQEGGEIEFPCFVKVDQSNGGLGVTQVNNQEELAAKLKSIREDSGWKKGIVLQESVDDVLEVPTFNFYLKKSGEIVWVGTAVSGFTGFSWNAANINWKDQDHYYNLVYEEFTKPIAKFLHEKGYFGFVNFECLITKDGKYLNDLNPRIATSTVHITAARYMASLGFDYSCFDSSKVVKLTGKEVVELADTINVKGDARVTILAYEDLEKGGSMISFAVFSKSMEIARDLREKIIGCN